ncbi:MAG TPA: Trm112 family protein [Pyrinomonadaceae bacterium]|nr:Trm112 family protein [Pyrinomonadaceae bacterium]
MLLSLVKSAPVLSAAHINVLRDRSMPISEQLLEILVCPADRAKVEVKPDGSGLKCVECKRVYPIRDDIPVMLIDEARIEDE